MVVRYAHVKSVVNLLGHIGQEGRADVAPGVSRYLDIAADLRARILGGEWELREPPCPACRTLPAPIKSTRDTVARAVATLEAEGLVWAVPRRGTIVRHGMSRPRRLRGNLVKRNLATDSPGYSFPSASGQEVWKHHITPVRAGARSSPTPGWPGCWACRRAPR